MSVAIKRYGVWLSGVAGVLLAIIFLTGSAYHRNPLVGSWRATDGTILIFRDDRSFVGQDRQGSLLFGNWSVLTDKRIGFQSHFRGGSYRPQYAEITPGGMHYICGDTDDFVECVAFDREKASQLVDSASLKFK